MQLARTNVLPPYTYDDDEGERSDDDYIEFYHGKLDEAVVAVNTYIERFCELSQRPDSDGAFAAYLASRQQFVKSLPFCDDELSSIDGSDNDSTYSVLRLYFADDRNRTFRDRDLQSLNKFRDLLCSYRAGLM